MSNVFSYFLQLIFIWQLDILFCGYLMGSYPHKLTSNSHIKHTSCVKVSFFSGFEAR